MDTKNQQHAYGAPAKQADGEDGPLGSNPVETGLGAVAGGAVGGAVAGTVAGPIGMAVGAIAGAVLGGAAGKGIAATVDPDAENRYWRDNHHRRPYYDSTYAYEDYAPAYQHAVSSWQQHPGRSFDEVEDHLHRDWGTVRGSSRLEWEHARAPTHDAWSRLHEAHGAARAPGHTDSALESVGKAITSPLRGS
jgi:hypothetical protein